MSYNNYEMPPCVEDLVKSIYISMDITEPEELDTRCLMDMVSEYFHIRLHYFDEPSEANNLGGNFHIFLNEKQSPQKQWQDFGHELGHILGHEGCQWGIPPLFRHYQEGQAKQFALHFCVPSFLLEQMATIDMAVLMKLFKVEKNFALHRIEMYRNKFLQLL
ncbi:ImmA/IrrE family metallo-endopeptidase [Virgibacillus xinjiangensis]|uniref:ImmA/IrrE family metallo-endopeptidase n=1 Tax=Virgibacillus xinjiangensis TaxID=393090 RepID=A0ABV7CYP3_9BACI